MGLRRRTGRAHPSRPEFLPHVRYLRRVPYYCRQHGGRGGSGQSGVITVTRASNGAGRPHRRRPRADRRWRAAVGTTSRVRLSRRVTVSPATHSRARHERPVPYGKAYVHEHRQPARRVRLRGGPANVLNGQTSMRSAPRSAPSQLRCRPAPPRPAGSAAGPQSERLGSPSSSPIPNTTPRTPRHRR